MTRPCLNKPFVQPPFRLRELLLTLPAPAENLALDHALLNSADAGAGAGEVLRLWEPAEPMVVLGRSSAASEEVDLDACAALRVPVLRRVSGGATIVSGPGCLMYAVLLDLNKRPEVRAVDRAHSLVFGALVSALRPVIPSLRCAGTSDLVVEQAGGLLKCSGNSLRVGRNWLVYHGTLLYDFDLGLVSRVLREPRRQPDYRERRPHQDFLTNLPIDRTTLVECVRAAFGAGEALHEWPEEETRLLVAKHYGREEWILQR
ncbi:MAG: lipoate--protein ligase family protein [Planctomycetales bacterium]|nr:lipoate--protein ligase family protein [Planctomycetales bacterium]